MSGWNLHVTGQEGKTMNFVFYKESKVCSFQVEAHFTIGKSIITDNRTPYIPRRICDRPGEKAV